MCVCVCGCVGVWVCGCVCYLQQKVHEADVSLHLVLKLVEDDEGGEREAPTLWTNQKADRHRQTGSETDRPLAGKTNQNLAHIKSLLLIHNLNYLNY